MCQFPREEKVGIAVNAFAFYYNQLEVKVILMNTEIAIITVEQMENLIYVIRGQKVMLDVDLAKVYGYETKSFNQQVKRNIEKFDNDFMFQLTKEEIELVRSQNVTSPKNELFVGQNGGTRYLPYAFTEQGIYMLMTVLKGELATNQSKALIRLFKGMKDYISSNVLISTDDFLKLSIQTNENTSAIARIENEMLKKSELPTIIKAFSKELASEYLFMNGEVCEANVTYQKIYDKAKKCIYIIDDYISLNTLLMIKNIKKNIEIVIFSDNKQHQLRLFEYNQFVEEYPNINIRFIKNNGIFHDRYIFIDVGSTAEKIYHCGASSKDAGKKITSITELKEKKLYSEMINVIKQHPMLVLK